MNLRISEGTKIYIAAPAKVATGGPELLHQLAYHLREDLNLRAYMYYWPADMADPVHPEYKIYSNPFVREVEDQSENILIVPEIVEGLHILRKFKQIRKVIWWLSLDNFVTSYVFNNKVRYVHITLMRVLNKLSRYFFGKSQILNVREVISRLYLARPHFVQNAINKLGIRPIDLHLCQSFYAMDYLRRSGIKNSAYLSDYLNKAFLREQFNIMNKEDIVVYNPKKDFNFTSKIIAHAPDIEFMPLINMTRAEVIEILKKAKVYIDFGNHPGKDRIPREAAILGCCVIVGKRGSATFQDDVPIPEEYKFTIAKKCIPEIVRMIRDCLQRYEEFHHHFDGYREFIRKETQRFVEDLKAIFLVRSIGE